MVSKAWWDLPWHNRTRSSLLPLFLTPFLTNLIVQPFSSGVNKLSQLLNPTIFSSLLLIPKFQRFLSEEDREGIENPEYETWEQQDQVLLTWLQSMLAMSVLSRVLGSAHSHEVWEQIHDYFHMQMRATARQLRTHLWTTMLGRKSMREYLLHIRAISDSLASVGSPIML